MRIARSCMVMNKDAVVVVNESLREKFKADREDNLALFLDIKNELTKSELHAPFKYGIKHSGRSVTVTAESRGSLGNLDPIIGQLVECFPEYQIELLELWLSWSEKTSQIQAKPVHVGPHTDVAVYLRSGTSVPLQIWILLESCSLSKPQESVAKDKSALECYLQICDGVLFPCMDKVLTPKGLVDWNPRVSIGGDQMLPGDILLFKNGVAYQNGPAVDDVFRVALGFKAILKNELAQIDERFRLWFREAMRNGHKLGLGPEMPYFDRTRQLLAGFPESYLQRMKSLIVDLPEQPVDYSRLVKKDHNDFSEIERRLKHRRFKE
jgi:hypothetical protein